MNRHDPLVVAVDLDGIIVRSAYPGVDKIDHRVVRRLIRIRTHGAYLVLNSCRHGASLAGAVARCHRLGLEFDAVNANLGFMIARWGETRKIGCHVSIDDRDICFSRGRMLRRLWVLAHLYRVADWYFRRQR